MNETRHARLLLAILRGRRDEAIGLGIGATDTSGGAFEPATFVMLCRQCEVHPWVHSLLDAGTHGFGWEVVGDEAHAALDGARRKVRHDNLLLLARLEQALELLSAEGICPVVLKGTDTLHRFYNGLDERALDDVDLLLRWEDLTRAVAALESGGFRAPAEPKRTRFIRSSHHLPLTSPGPITVDFELHWNVAQDGRYRIDVEGLFKRAVPQEIAGKKVLRLEDHDAVAHLLIHHFSHYLARGLKGAVDMQQITSAAGFDWSRVAAKIRNWDGVSAAGISLLHLNKMWPELLGPAVLAAMPVARWRRAVLSPLLSSHPLELYKFTSNRKIQLFLAGMMLERFATLPSWILHRARRNQQPGSNPLDPSASGGDGQTATAGK